MKRLWIAAALIALLVVLAAGHVLLLGRFTGQLIGQLEQAEQNISRGDWAEAQALAGQAWQSWERQAFYLHTTLHHADIDAVRASFRELLAFLAIREDTAECAAVCARLINQLELLLEAELPSLKNLL